MLLRKFKKTLVVILVFSSFVFGASSAFAYEIWYGGGFRPHPTTVRPYSTFDSASKTAMQNAASQWNGAGANTLVTIGSDTSNTAYPNDNDINEVTKGTRGTNTYLMETNATSTGWEWNGVWYSHVIYEADIDVNISHPWGNGSSTSFYDVGQVFTHELGHLLGLDHSDVTGATMISGSAKGETYKRSIEDDDKYGILDIY